MTAEVRLAAVSLPADWRAACLGDLCLGKGAYGANVSKAAFDPTLPRYVRITDILADGRLNADDPASISEEAAAQYILKPGDVLLARSGATVGKSYVHEARYGRCAHAGYLIRFRTRPDLLLPDFLKQYLRSPLYWKWVAETQRAQAQPNINAAEYGALLIPTPPLGEQGKIAAILSSVDEAIEATQTVIDQLQIARKAMMAELLTRGLPGRHTRFKQTEIGELPEDWEMLLLDQVAKRGSGHTPNKLHPEYWDGEIKWVSLKDSARLDRLYIDDSTAKITPLGIANSSAVEHPAGTVVLSRDAGVGKSAITTDTMAVSQHFMAWVCGPRLDNHYLYYRLQFLKPDFERIAIGNTIKTIGLPYFKAFRVPVPPLDEQQVIARTLKAADLRLFAEESTVAGLKGLKAALMSVLLTGEVRVKPDEEAA